MILYHITSDRGIVGMVKEGQIQSSTAIASSDADINKGRVYFLSTARTRVNAYSKDYAAAMLVLDGTKLKQKYKTAPVDYWANPKYSESEERILTNVPHIPLWTYLKELSINLEYFTDMSDLRKVVMKCKLKGVPVYLFRNSKDMYTNNRNRRVDLSSVDLTFLKPAKQQFFPQSRERLTLEPYLALIHAMGTNRFKRVAEPDAKTPASKAVSDLVYDIKRYMRYGEVHQVLSQLTSELNSALRRGGRSYNQAISLLNLVRDRKQTLEQVAKELGKAVLDLD